MEKDAVTILVIDDDPEVLWATERIIAGAGFRVVTGSRAETVLDLARQHRPALVLLDVVLADGDGVDVARRLKADPELAGIFIILLSGARTSADDQVRGLAEGFADGYITRPIAKLELLARIDAFLRIRVTQEALRTREAEVLMLNTQLEVRITERDEALAVREIEVYIRDHSEAEFTHGLCPQCAHAFLSGSPIGERHSGDCP